MPGFLQKLAREEKGQVIVIIAVAFTVLLGFTALVIDTGILYLENNRLASAADAAALAGAQELPDTAAALAAANNFAQLNGVAPGTLNVTFSQDNKEITVAVNREVDLYFAQILGFHKKTVNGQATARIAPVSEVSGLLPLGINETRLPLASGTEYMIKGGPHDESPWTGIIGFENSNNADDYRDWAQTGYAANVSYSDIINKAPGNKSGPTQQGIQFRISSCLNGCTWNNYEPDCQKVVLVPIYRDLGANVQVVGFASMFLERIDGSGLDNRIWARYVPTTVSAATDDAIINSYLYSVRLSQ